MGPIVFHDSRRCNDCGNRAGVLRQAGELSNLSDWLLTGPSGYLEGLTC